MFTVRRQQFDAMAAEWQRSRRAAFVARLRQELPDRAGALLEPELQKQVEDGCNAAEVLSITETDHVYRFLRLRYLPASVWERSGAQEMLVRVLTDTTLGAGRRLQFVETSLAVERA